MTGINNITSSPLINRLLPGHMREMIESQQRLATGQRINQGKDDPAGLITSENLRAVLAALEAETRSLQRMDQIANTAEGALGQISDLLIEAESLAVANANDAGLSPEEKQANQMQLDSILGTINRIGGSTTFNGKSLLDGSLTLSANGDEVSVDNVSPAHLGQVEIDGATYSLADLGSGGALNIVDGDVAEARETLQAAREQISAVRGRIGAFQSHTIGAGLAMLNTSIENIAAAESEIRDTDYAQETANASRLRILNDVGFRLVRMEASEAKNVLRLIG